MESRSSAQFFYWELLAKRPVCNLAGKRVLALDGANTYRGAEITQLLIYSRRVTSCYPIDTRADSSFINLWENIDQVSREWRYRHAALDATRQRARYRQQWNRSFGRSHWTFDRGLIELADDSEILVSRHTNECRRNSIDHP